MLVKFCHKVISKKGFYKVNNLVTLNMGGLYDLQIPINYSEMARYKYR